MSRNIPIAPLADYEIRRFEAKVQHSSGCWIWLGSKCDKGYGTLRLKRGGKWVLAKAHRVSFTINHGRIPDGMEIMHRCDNPPCVRPDHLAVGSHLDNMRDMVAKGRSGRTLWMVGDINPHTSIPDVAVVEIRERAHAGESVDDLAKEFDCHRQTVQRIVTGRSRLSAGGPIRPLARVRRRRAA